MFVNKTTSYRIGLFLFVDGDDRGHDLMIKYLKYHPDPPNDPDVHIQCIAM